MWNSDIPLPRRPRWQGIKASINVIAVDGISQRFYPHPLIKTSAILSLDEDATLNTDEIDFAFTVWRLFPDRIVGYPARSHYWDDSKVFNSSTIQLGIACLELLPRTKALIKLTILLVCL